MTLTRWSDYLRLWRGLGRELAYVLITLPIAIFTTVTLWTGVGLGLGLTVVWLGIPVLVATLLVARWLGGIELKRLELAGRPPIVLAAWSSEPSRPGLSGRVLLIVADSRYWVQALHGAVISLVLSIATWSVVIVWLAVALGGPTVWYWQRWVRVEPAHSAALYAVAGLLAIATLPYVVHATVLVHDFAARRMLGEWRITALRRDAALSEASRESAILAEDSSLRRLERDIHDGPQQGLLRIQFDLASASRALEPHHPALHLVQSALRVAEDTLTELRELSRGLAPPLLQDRGLESAIRALAARSEVRVTTTFSSVDDPGIADLERSVYFIVSELLSNVAKHSEATSAHVGLFVETGTDSRRRLSVKISDNGIGGAKLIRGHGLEGLNQRIVGLRGSLAINSPRGGPSQFAVEIPLR